MRNRSSVVGKSGGRRSAASTTIFVLTSACAMILEPELFEPEAFPRPHTVYDSLLVSS